jgi:hypothetical protein
MANKNWKASDLTGAEYLGAIALENGEDFKVFSLPDRLVFGGFCNAGFLESGFVSKEEGETQTEVLTKSLADLEIFYRDGEQYVSSIVCNERM